MSGVSRESTRLRCNTFPAVRARRWGACTKVTMIRSSLTKYSSTSKATNNTCGVQSVRTATSLMYFYSRAAMAKPPNASSGVCSRAITINHERLCRYMARSPLSNERLSIDGAGVVVHYRPDLPTQTSNHSPRRYRLRRAKCCFEIPIRGARVVKFSRRWTNRNEI